MNREELRLILEDYKLDCHLPIHFMKHSERFETVSWTYWAIDELYDYIILNSDVRSIDSILNAIKRFINMMAEYMYNFTKTRPLFFCAAETARDIYELLLYSKPRN